MPAMQEMPARCRRYRICGRCKRCKTYRRSTLLGNCGNTMCKYMIGGTGRASHPLPPPKWPSHAPSAMHREAMGECGNTMVTPVFMRYGDKYSRSGALSEKHAQQTGKGTPLYPFYPFCTFPESRSFPPRSLRTSDCMRSATSNVALQHPEDTAKPGRRRSTPKDVHRAQFRAQ